MSDFPCFEPCRGTALFVELSSQSRRQADTPPPERQSFVSGQRQRQRSVLRCRLGHPLVFPSGFSESHTHNATSSGRRLLLCSLPYSRTPSPATLTRDRLVRFRPCQPVVCHAPPPPPVSWLAHSPLSDLDGCPVLPLFTPSAAVGATGGRFRTHGDDVAERGRGSQGADGGAGGTAGRPGGASRAGREAHHQNRGVSERPLFSFLSNCVCCFCRKPSRVRWSFCDRVLFRLSRFPSGKPSWPVLLPTPPPYYALTALPPPPLSHPLFRCPLCPLCPSLSLPPCMNAFPPCARSWTRSNPGPTATRRSGFPIPCGGKTWCASTPGVGGSRPRCPRYKCPQSLFRRGLLVEAPPSAHVFPTEQSSFFFVLSSACCARHANHAAVHLPSLTIISPKLRLRARELIRSASALEGVGRPALVP